MNAIGRTLSELHDGESRLAIELRAVSERHRSEHEVYHVARDLERWSMEHVRRLAEIGRNYGQELCDDPHRAGRPLGGIRDQVADPNGRHPRPGLLLLRDLRNLYVVASGNSLSWEMLAQAAQASRNTELLNLATACHPQTLRQVRWANTLIKTMSPQILTSL
jgi:hypothetical protein